MAPRRKAIRTYDRNNYNVMKNTERRRKKKAKMIIILEKYTFTK